MPKHPFYFVLYAPNYVRHDDLSAVHTTMDKELELAKELFKKTQEMSLGAFPRVDIYHPEWFVFNLHPSAARSLNHYRTFVGSDHESQDRYAAENLYKKFIGRAYLPVLVVAHHGPNVRRVEGEHLQYESKYILDAIQL